MSSTIIYSQNTSKCFKPQTIDTLYKIERAYVYLNAENKVLNVALSTANVIKSEQSAKIKILELNQSKYDSIVKNYKEIEQRNDQVINNLDYLIRVEKKKKWNWLVKGIIIGAGGVLILNIL